MTPCPPWLAVRTLTVDISGQAVHDPTVQRSLRTRVKLRNDSVTGECRD